MSAVFGKQLGPAEFTRALAAVKVADSALGDVAENYSTKCWANSMKR